MTALRPVESWDVTAVSDHDVERKHLRKLLLNTTCAHPDCDKPTESMHHAWPVGTLKSSSWLVRIPGVDKPVLHAIGLCGTGTTGHHGDLEEHRGWVRYEDGEFVWYDRSQYAVSPWEYIGKLDPQPGKGSSNPAQNGPEGRVNPEGSKTRKSKKLKGEVRPYRAQWNVGVPKDERENGADVLDELELALREKFSEEMGWSETAPRYMIVTAAFVRALQ